VGRLSAERAAEQARRVYDVIVDCPGVTAGDVGRGLGVPSIVVKNMLIAMERLGLYVSEDAYGGLYPFEYCGEYPPSLEMKGETDDAHD